MTAPAVDIIEACSDPKLFARWFRNPETWRSWFTFLRVLFGLPMGEEDWALFQQCTGRDDRPEGGFHHAYLIVGRRGGKSLMLALIAVFLAAFTDWSPYLSPGERGTVMAIATDRRQERVIFRYVRALLCHVPMLASLVERETADSIDLTNDMTIEIQTASFRSVRGYTLIAGLLDELAFWPSDEAAASPDTETLAAIRPAMASVRGARLLCASTPYAKKGALWSAYKKNFGQSGSAALVWKADTRTMNPTIPSEEVAEAEAEDPASAAAEYGAEFRTDIESFVSREAVDACTTVGLLEIPPIPGIGFRAFVDPAGGSGLDSMTLALSYVENSGVAVLAAIRERKPQFSPDDCVDEFVQLLRAYNVTEVTGDRWVGSFVSEAFEKRGVRYVVSDRAKSDIYRELLPLLNSRKVELLDHPKLLAQLLNLERKTARGGRDSIDHPSGQGPSAHDDLINSAAGSLVLASGVGANGVDLDEFVRAWLPGVPSHFEEAEERKRRAAASVD